MPKSATNPTIAPSDKLPPVTASFTGRAAELCLLDNVLAEHEKVVAARVRQKINRA